MDITERGGCLGHIEVVEYVQSTCPVGTKDSIILDLQQRLRQLRLESWPESAADELLFLSGGPISDLSGQSMIAGPPNTRLVLRQPIEIESKAKLDALSGELEFSKPPSLEVHIEHWSTGWQLERCERVEALADVFEIATSLQPQVPEGWPSAVSKHGEMAEDCKGQDIVDLVRPGCIAGLLGYDLSRWTNPARRAKPPAPGTVLGCLYIIDAWLIHNRRHGLAKIIAEANHPWAKIDISSLLPAPEQESSTGSGHYCAIESESDSSHVNRVKRVINSIHGGHLYQLNYGRNWSGPMADEPWLAMRRLANTNPAPFAGWMHIPDLGLAIISASPESLLAVKSRHLATRPIKGTRPRGRDRASDVLLMHEMVGSRKEVAEHMMLVDLSRNDIGRVCSPGTVRWSDWRVEALPQVQHMVSEVSGKLRDNVTLGGAVHALFPGGSITGCPKIATIAAISQLEETPRGAWTGSLGILDERQGIAMWNILIRTLEANREAQFDELIESESSPTVEIGQRFKSAAAPKSGEKLVSIKDASTCEVADFGGIESESRFGGKQQLAWHASIKAGGGIIIESDARMEVEEARWKAAALIDATWSEGSDSAFSGDSVVSDYSEKPAEPVDFTKKVNLNFLSSKLATAQPEHHPIPEIDEQTSALLERLELERISARKDGQTSVATGSIIPFDLINNLTEPAQNRCLLVDNLDSFTWNIVHALLELGADVVVVPGRGSEAPEPDLKSVMTLLEKANPTHIILGPGPSTPSSTPFTLSLAHLSLVGENRLPPLLGICLGHQALGVAAGWSLAPTSSGAVHGVPSKISHDGTGLFIDLPEVTTMMRYHSLSISQQVDGQLASESEIFDSSNGLDRLGDLVVSGAADEDELRQDGILVANGWSDDGVVMSIRHTSRPIHGIQFHPESCGSIEGSHLLSQFLTETNLTE